MRIAMIGTGYVGLVSGACFSDFGHVVACIDKDPGKIRELQKGKLPIFEPGLDAIVASNVAAGRLSFTTEPAAAVRAADAVFLAVGTPSRRGDGFADLSYVYDAANEIAPEIEGFTVIAIKSTVPVGTNDEVDAIVRKLRPDADFSVVSNPEFLREGAAIEDFKHPDRVIVGTDDERARRIMRELYRPLFINETPMLFTGRRSAELIKYASNAFLATKITFINEMADLCEKCGADVQEVARGMGLDRRIAAKFLHAGPGFGGSCFPKDIAALAAIGERYDVATKIVSTVMAVNDARKRAMVTKVVSACGGSLQGKTIAVLGLTFKPNTDDMREAPSLVIVPSLEAQGARVRAYDPHGMAEARKLMPQLETTSDPYACIEGADAMLILTEWDQFRALDLDRVKKTLRSPVVIDLRNIYRPAELAAKGLNYISVGRG
ncbi:MAG: UDP-glucose/GDP-mannose dehydrogenase family protein [Alphaproteobacteria bacterium]|nr:MAG: UDP-glucose/GDP-mannose dehydrogenase family protein [Alphaproteobacteria bacterium]